MRQVKRGDAARVVGYIRVSTDEQALGPEAQRQALDRWCAQQGATLVAVVEEPHRHGKASGGAELADRPGLLQAIDLLAEHGAGTLLVAKRDRLARDVMVAAMVERLAERNGGRILSVAGEGTGGEDPAAVLMRRMVDAFAEYERALIRARTSAALQVKKGKWERISREIPWGFRLAADGVHLEPEPGEQEVIVEARALRAQGLSLRAIATRLGETGRVSRTGRPFAAQQIARMQEA